MAWPGKRDHAQEKTSNDTRSLVAVAPKTRPREHRGLSLVHRGHSLTGHLTAPAPPCLAPALAQRPLLRSREPGCQPRRFLLGQSGPFLEAQTTAATPGIGAIRNVSVSFISYDSVVFGGSTSGFAQTMSGQCFHLLSPRVERPPAHFPRGLFPYALASFGGGN